MTVKEVEERTGLPRANIRYYESEGLIHPNRGENGYRDYRQEDVDTLLKIKLLRQLGGPVVLIVVCLLLVAVVAIITLVIVQYNSRPR